MVEMDLNEDTRHLVQNVPGVTRFIGSGQARRRSRRTKCGASSARWRRRKSQAGADGVVPVGEHVKVVDGPFSDFTGLVDEVNPSAEGEGDGRASSAARRRSSSISSRCSRSKAVRWSAGRTRDHGEDQSGAYGEAAVPAGNATPAPPVGPALGQHGVNIMDFCKQFNARTQAPAGLMIPVVITIYNDRSFTFITKTPPAAVLLKRAAGLAKGSGVPNRNKVGKVTAAQVREIAELKMPDLNAASRRRGREHGERHRAHHGHRGRRLAPAVVLAGPAGRFRMPVPRTASLTPHVGAPCGAPEPRGGLMRHGKNYRSSAERIASRAKETLALKDAVSLVKSSAKAKFDETVEIASHLGVDPRHSDQLVRGTVVLPHGTGKSIRVLVFTKGEDPGTVRLTIRDASGNVVVALAARSGETVSASSVLLRPGSYTARFTIDNANGEPVTFWLRGGSTSNPIGPVLSDPTLTPQYTTPPPPPGQPPYFAYPGFSVPYDPATLPGYVNPNDPSTYPPGFTLPPHLAHHPWLVVTTDPFYWIALTV